MYSENSIKREENKFLVVDYTEILRWSLLEKKGFFKLCHMFQIQTRME